VRSLLEALNAESSKSWRFPLNAWPGANNGSNNVIEQDIYEPKHYQG